MAISVGKLTVKINGQWIPFAIEQIPYGFCQEPRFRLVSRPLWVPLDNKLFRTFKELIDYYASRAEPGAVLKWQEF